MCWIRAAARARTWPKRCGGLLTICKARGLGALTGARVKQAATERVFGFEIMPAPFVVAHLQVGLTMQDLDAPLAEDGAERAGIFLTNALTGWEPHSQELVADSRTGRRSATEPKRVKQKEDQFW